MERYRAEDKRWWRIESASYSDWTDDEREADAADEDGAEVFGPFVPQPLGAVDALRMIARVDSGAMMTDFSRARRMREIAAAALERFGGQ